MRSINPESPCNPLIGTQLGATRPTAGRAILGSEAWHISRTLAGLDTIQIMLGCIKLTIPNLEKQFMSQSGCAQDQLHGEDNNYTINTMQTLPV